MRDISQILNEVPFASDHLFLNSAYLSEQWAARDLQEKYDSGFCRAEGMLEQIEDEKRHARMLKKAMQSQGFEPIEDLTLAMQEVIYRRICGLSLKDMDGTLAEFWGMHNVMERRALWNYRTYLKGGRIPLYKDILHKIIEDERGHLKKVPEHEVVVKLAELDNWVYRKHLYKHYNRMDLIRCDSFWVDYFNDELKRDL